MTENSFSNTPFFCQHIKILMDQHLKRPKSMKYIQSNKYSHAFSSPINHSRSNYFPGLLGSLPPNNIMLLRSVSNVLTNTTTLQHTLLTVKTFTCNIYNLLQRWHRALWPIKISRVFIDCEAPGLLRETKNLSCS